MRDPLKQLQQWYLANCNGDWEHSYGVTIETLDNPGWSVEIDLAGTRLSDAILPRARVEHDWVHYWAEDEVFRGYGGPANLEELLSVFLGWAKRYRD